MKATPRKHKGTIVIVALLVFSLVQIVLLGIIEFHGFELLHTKDLKEHNQDVQLLVGGEKWAAGLLKQQKQAGTAMGTYVLPPTQTQYGVIEAVIEDMQSRVNINNPKLGETAGIRNFFLKFFPDKGEEQLKPLFEFLNIPIESELAENEEDEIQEDENESESESVNGLLEGVDLDEETIEALKNLPEGTSPQEYLAQQQNKQKQPLSNIGSSPKPGQSNGVPLISSVTELLPQRVLTKEEFINVLPYMTAINNLSNININTAPMPVLMSLSSTMTPEIATQIVQARESNGPFKDISQLNTLVPAFAELKLDTGQLVTESDYFRVQIKLKRDDQVIQLYTWMAVTKQSNYIQIQILARSFGTI